MNEIKHNINLASKFSFTLQIIYIFVMLTDGVQIRKALLIVTTMGSTNSLPMENTSMLRTIMLKMPDAVGKFMLLDVDLFVSELTFFM